MTDADDGVLIVAGEFACAYVGQTFRLWRVDDAATMLYVELICGHPLWVTRDAVQLSLKGQLKLKEMDMSKKKDEAVQNPALATTNVPAPVPARPKLKPNGGALPVPGYEGLVEAYKQKAETLKWIKKEVDSIKQDFRAAARNVAAQHPSVTSLAFQAPDGVVKVSLPDITMEGNRTTIKPEDVADAAQRGLDLTPHIESTKSYVLRGDFVEWIDTLLSQWAEQGVQIPEGLEEKVITKLSAEGAKELKAQAESGDAVAAEAIKQFTKDPSVR